MVKVLIFAGGTGRRMNARTRPKQFLMMHGRPIILYTLEKFERHPDIGEIVIVCLEGWIDRLWDYIHQYMLKKVTIIVPGGPTGHDSIYNGLVAMEPTTDPRDIVLIHDGVRPLITPELITTNIQAVKNYGNAITAEAVRESVVRSHDGVTIDSVPPRDEMYVAKAPQSFYYGDIKRVYDHAQAEGRKSIDSAQLCSIYGLPLHMIHSTKNNLKITEPADYYIYRALYDAEENEQVVL